MLCVNACLGLSITYTPRNMLFMGVNGGGYSEVLGHTSGAVGSLVVRGPQTVRWDTESQSGSS